MNKLRFLLPLLAASPLMLVFIPSRGGSSAPAEALTLTFAGDLMANAFMADVLARDAGALDPVKPYLDGDLNFANLEFTVDTNRPPQGYPQFNGTREYLRYFKNYFNILSVANNHVFDQGARSQADTLAFLAEDGVLCLGGNTQSPHTPPLRTNLKGVDLLFTAYSMVDNGLNGRSTNGAGRYYMNFYPSAAETVLKIKGDLQGVPASTLKIISLHFGEEYKPIPNASDELLPQLLIEAGADIIVGHHPHTPRPALWYEGKNHSGVILYSLGNFYTPHKNSYPYLDAGTVVRLEVRPGKQYRLRYMPTFTYFYSEGGGVVSRVLPLVENPKLNPPRGYAFTERDKRNMKDAYDVVHRFYEPLALIAEGRTPE